MARHEKTVGPVANPITVQAQSLKIPTSQILPPLDQEALKELHIVRGQKEAFGFSKSKFLNKWFLTRGFLTTQGAFSKHTIFPHP